VFQDPSYHGGATEEVDESPVASLTVTRLDITAGDAAETRAGRAGISLFFKVLKLEHTFAAADSGVVAVC
jgi:hypothetical protein